MTTLSTSPYHLTPPSTSSRPTPKRLLSLQTNMLVRPSPYPSISPPGSPGAGTSTSTGTTGPKRPGAPRRSHSFCGDSSSSTYALASASAGGHLTADKRALVAPPLERTISSIGSRGNCSPLSQQMPRPFSMYPTPVSTPMRETPPELVRSGGEGTRYLQESNRANISQQSPPRSPTLNGVPKILIHPSTTPPRPSLSAIQATPTPFGSYTTTTSTTTSSRSSSFSTASPTTPSMGMFFENPIPEEEALEVVEKIVDLNNSIMEGEESMVEDVVEGVSDLVMA